MKIYDFEVFKFAENQHRPFENNGSTFMLNKSPYLDIVLTDYCNQDCQFCIADLVHKKKVLSMDAIKEKVTFAIEQMGVREVLLLGGEPTLAKNLVATIKWLSTLGLDKIIMTTNGLRLANNKKFRHEVFSAGLTHVNVSFMSVAKRIQAAVTNNTDPLEINDIARIYQTAKKFGVAVRINNNIYKGNNDTAMSAWHFYRCVSNCCDSLKFSPIFEVDLFSVVNHKTEWAKEHSLKHDYLEVLFNKIEQHFVKTNGVSIIENPLQFGFVKNTLIPLTVPIIMNWNFGRYTGMMDKVVNKRQINNIKLLATGDLSLSWNRELSEYFIKTK